ncbi:MAG: choice-of-anchor Q domain-containing protein [Candidatus Acidiferrales bacterium]
MSTSRWKAILVLALLSVVCASRAAAQSGSVIYVTDLVGDSGQGVGCSLTDALYSSMYHQAIAIVSIDDTTGNVTTAPTGCVVGQGDDVIVLPTGDTPVTITLLGSVIGPNNSVGPSATPEITGKVTIQGNGATLNFVPCLPVTNPCPPTASIAYASQTVHAFVVASTGNLSLQDLHIQGFTTRGGDGQYGGGGGLGAGGAIYVQGGIVNASNVTFDSNTAIGGNGGSQTFGYTGGGGGGGGMHGNGGGVDGGGASGGTDTTLFYPGGGGGGAFGDGATGVYGTTNGAGGGGTGLNADFAGDGGLLCGGYGGYAYDYGLFTANGQDAPCPGGGGGGGYASIYSSSNGGAGNYGGGGGGGGSHGGNGGNGGFGGGGGSGWAGSFGGTTGGNGGFGGGGGSAANGILLGSGYPGSGGPFGGNAGNSLGGGGGALGGAIFNDGGTITVRNSTFYNNVAVRGNGGGAPNPGQADNGADAGGAIFSHNGSTTLQHVTISNNQTTGPYGGVYIYRDSTGSATFNLYNSIIVNNGDTIESPNECVMAGTGIQVLGTGNIIGQNDNCPGFITNVNPSLGPLQNNGGLTPTMAIPNGSSAQDTANAAYALSFDQRGTVRPQGAGYDVGAFEVCPFRPFLGEFCTGTTYVPPPTYTLTIQAISAAGGTTDPPPGVYAYPVGTVRVIKAIANPGDIFGGWSGYATAPSLTTTTVVMNQPQSIVANFTDPKTTVAGNIVNKVGSANNRFWIMSLTNNGPGYVIGAYITSFTLVQTAGAACTPIYGSAGPGVTNIPVGQTADFQEYFDFSSCPAAARFTATFGFTANNGTLTGTVVRTNQFE